MSELIENILFVGQGMLMTLEILIGSMLFGLVFGSGLAILRFNNVAKKSLERFISLVRGIPLILHLSFIYFAIPNLIGFKINILMAGILSLGLNSAVYTAEILRAGLESLPKGQFEAAKTLNISGFYLWKDIILPQVYKNVSPALINELISLLKDTALVSTIGGMELMRKAQVIAAEQFTYFLPLCIAAGYYYSMVLLFEKVGKTIAKRGAYANC